MPLADLAADDETVELGQHPVEDHEVGADGLDRLQPLLPIERLNDLMAVLAELAGDQLVQIQFVFDDEDPSHTRIIPCQQPATFDRRVWCYDTRRLSRPFCRYVTKVSHVGRNAIVGAP